jgi:hypothetical protein
MCEIKKKLYHPKQTNSLMEIGSSSLSITTIKPLFMRGLAQ